jgi:mannose-6-phosphate isomerase-like protein (cupin superfamily)
MAKVGDVIHSPTVGDRIVFLKTARDTNGELLEFDDFLKVGGNGPIEHIHPRQEERLTVVSGVMTASIGGKEMSFQPGECGLIPPGIAHRWWNGGNVELHIRAEFRPALDMERFFETFFGLAVDGKTDDKGVPDFMQIVASSPYYEIFLPKPPIPLQRVMFAVLGPIARLRGYRPWYPAYSRDQN